MSRVCNGDHAWWLSGVWGFMVEKDCLRKRSLALIDNSEDLQCEASQTSYTVLKAWAALDGTHWEGLTKKDIVLK